MKKRRFIVGLMLGAAVLAVVAITGPFVRAQSASQAETGKLVNVLRIDNNGSVFVAVQNPGPSAACNAFTVLAVGNISSQAVRTMYGALLAAKLSNTTVSIDFNPAGCVVTGVNVP